MDINTIYNLDCIDFLRKVPDSFCNTCITSPPYFNLRDYGHEGQIGLEKTPEEYVQKLVEVFREVRRALRDDGTLWLNLGDSYASGKKISGNYKPKDLIGIPWMVAFALRADGWYLRQDIIWNKPNPMPESVKDRCTKSHEYIFMFSKKQKYYFDYNSIKVPLKDQSIARLAQDIEKQKGSSRAVGKTNGTMKAVSQKLFDSSMGGGGTSFKGHSGYYKSDGTLICADGKANKKSVWTVSTKPFKDAHFATFPVDLIEPCVLAGCPVDGVCIDPFMGAGTTAITAIKNRRNFIGSELNPEYVALALKRINSLPPYQFTIL